MLRWRRSRDPNYPAPDPMSAQDVNARIERATLCPVCGALPGLHRSEGGQYMRCPLTGRTLHGQRAYATLTSERPDDPAPLTWLERMAPR